MFTLNETAEIFKISHSTLRRLIKKKEIEYVIVNGGKRFTKKNIDDFIEKNTVKAEK